jgi:hypothetical protein
VVAGVAAAAEVADAALAAAAAAPRGVTAAGAKWRRLLAGTIEPTRLTRQYEMAGSDKVDPAILCLLSQTAGGSSAQADAAMTACRVSNQFKKC